MENCIFCKIAAGEIPSAVVYEDEYVLAFKDINPVAPVHILIIPRLHISTFNDIEPEHKDLMGHISLVCKDIARSQNVDEQGYRLVINCGRDGGQEVNHLHVHLLGGRRLTGIAAKR